MEGSTIGLLGLGLMLLMIFAHVPIGVAMGLAGLLTFGMIRGDFMAAASLVSTETVDRVASTELAVIPLFLLMGSFATIGGLSADLYRVAYAFVGHMRGGLAVATIGGCAGFGAICGSSVATTATMTKVSLAEMVRRNYSQHLATGSIAAGGTLGMLIPPSIIFVLYGVLTEQFVKTLFVAALVPALLAVALHVATIAIIVRIRPQAGPAGERSTWAERWQAVRSAGASLILMIIVTGGIYAGVFSVTESASVGAVLAFGIALVRGRITSKTFWSALRETAATTSMIYLLMIGASIFTYAITLSTLPEILVGAAGRSGLSPLAVVMLLMVMYLILGSIFDTVSSMVITMPFVFPLILGYGLDPIWWGVINVMVIEIGMITPPIGLNVFVMKAMLPDTTLKTIFTGVGPFIVADILRLLVLILFPVLAIWLPNLLGLPR